MSTQQDDTDDEDYLERHEGMKVRQTDSQIDFRVPNASEYTAPGTMLAVVVEGDGYTFPLMHASVNKSQRITVPTKVANQLPISGGDHIALVVDEVIVDER